MSDFNFNGLDDLQIENTQSTFGKFVLYMMLAVFALASMVTTFSFFVTYAPRLGAALHPVYGPYIAGMLGVVLFDLAGLGWTVLRARNSDTTRQFVIATGAAVAAIILALLTSGLQVLLSTSFDVGIYQANGSLTEFGQAMQLTGVIVMTLGFVLNFGAIALYVNTSKGITQAVQNTQLRAYVTAGRFAADQARAGQENTVGYVGRTFTGLDTPRDEVDDEAVYDLDTLVDYLVEERLRERELSLNGKGANFTTRPNGR
jgi:hypothetical protein